MVATMSPSFFPVYEGVTLAGVVPALAELINHWGTYQTSKQTKG